MAVALTFWSLECNNAQLFISILPRSAALPGNGMLITSADLNLEGQSCCLVPGYTVQLTISAIKKRFAAVLTCALFHRQRGYLDASSRP
jgi:hypothetical protein